MLTPERSIEIQGLLGADIQMQLDECVQLPAADEAVEKAMRLSLRWAERCRIAFGAPAGAGAVRHRAGRARSSGCGSRARGRSSALDFNGYAIGGLAVGEPQAAMLAHDRDGRAAPAGRQTALPHGRRHAGRHRRGGRGAASTCSTACCRRGPGATARAYTRFGRLNLKNARYADDPEPLDAASKHAPANTYSKAYLHHLVRSNEILGMMLLTWNNLAYYQDLMAGLRKAIAEGRSSSSSPPRRTVGQKPRATTRRRRRADRRFGRASSVWGEPGRVSAVLSHRFRIVAMRADRRRRYEVVPCFRCRPACS